MKKKKLIPKEFEPTFGLAGLSLGSSILGGAFDSTLPLGTKNPLTTMGSTTSKFITPMATLGVMNFTMNQFNKTGKKMKGGKK